MDTPTAALTRLGLAVATAAAVVTAALTIPADDADRVGQLTDRHEASRQAALEKRPHRHPAGTPPHRHRAAYAGMGDGHGHDHSDPTTKNAISRAGETGTAVQDPTTAVQARSSEQYVESQRNLPDPRLRTVSPYRSRTEIPQDRYAAANGCYAIQTPDRRRWLTRAATGELVARRGTRSIGLPLHFRATELGKYLLYGPQRDFAAGTGDVSMIPAPSDDTVWTMTRTADRRFRFRHTSGQYLTMVAGQPTLGATPASFGVLRTSGCTAYPESATNVSGNPHAGVSSFQEVRGYVDAHTHGMAFEFLGGAHCGKPWDRFGAPYALVDCNDHRATGGTNALETALSGKPRHDPVGWPTFKDWPAPESLTHEGTYYKWMERSWRGGQRVFVNLLVENNQLCRAYPFKRDGLSDVTCDEMESVKRQAHDMYRFQDYVDAQWGGPGRGWYRIVTTPWQARRVINAGKMAVVMGIETSVPFGCTMKVDVPQCNAASIDAQLAEMHRLGVRQMELVNKFDNALSGVAGDEGEVGMAVNTANFTETGSFWDMERCAVQDPEVHDQDQLAAPAISGDQQDAMFGAISQLYGAGVALPVYPPPHHCNTRGLTPLGKHLVNRLAQRHMLFDPDHMSVRGRNAALDEMERLRYPGVLSSHSWSTPDAYPRIYALGGFVAPYAGDSTGFVDKWRRHLTWADSRYYFGFGFGADINGLGAQGNPRGAGAPNAVRYPFTGLNGVTVNRQRAGERVYDVNTDGVAQYGLYPDWIEDTRRIAGANGDGAGADLRDDMARGAEAYLQTWERAEGIRPDSCRNPGQRRWVSGFRNAVRRGMTTRQVMGAVGQPWQRLGRTYTYCAKASGAPRVVMKVDLTAAGRVAGVRRAG